MDVGLSLSISQTLFCQKLFFVLVCVTIIINMVIKYGRRAGSLINMDLYFICMVQGQKYCVFRSCYHPPPSHLLDQYFTQAARGVKNSQILTLQMFSIFTLYSADWLSRYSVIHNIMEKNVLKNILLLNCIPFCFNQRDYYKYIYSLWYFQKILYSFIYFLTSFWRKYINTIPVLYLYSMIVRKQNILLYAKESLAGNRRQELRLALVHI